MTTIKVGQTVETSGEQQGLVRYVGPIHVSDGTFVGIELSTATGKNDGSVRGERYFTCPPGHGLFVRDNSVQVIAQAPPPRATPTATAQPAAVGRPRAPTARTRPSSVVAPKTAARASTINRRQSIAPAPSTSNLRNPARTSSISSSVPGAMEAPPRPAPSASRPSIASSSSTGNAAKAARDSNIETLQTKIRHLEKQHQEDQERLRELTQTRDERDRFSNLIQKLQHKCQTQYAEAQELKDKVRQLQSDNETLRKGQQDHEVDLEDALVDKEMAEERADQAETEVETLRQRLEERDLELDILRDEAQLYTADMSEDEKQEAGYYRLQHENERLRHALIVLREVTENTEQDYKARVSELEGDLARMETLEQENAALHERTTQSDALIEHLKQQLDAANEWEDVVGELTHQNQNLQDRIAEQDMVVQDLENLRELNDELEAQHLEQEEDMLLELEAKNNELAEQARRLIEQSAIIADNESLITKFRDLVMDLQTRMAHAESSKTMTEAQVKDATGRFNEVMDLNRQLRAATVLSTTKEIESSLTLLKAEQLEEKLNIWNETESKEFSRSESLQAYLAAERIAGKAQLLIAVLTTTARQMSNGGRLDDAMSRLVCSKSISHLAVLRDGSKRLCSAMRGLSLADFANIAPTYQELVTVEHILDQGLNALKADTINFEEFAGSIERSTKTQDAILSSHQDALAGRPEEELLFLVSSVRARLEYVDYVYNLATFALQKVPFNILEECEYTQEHFKLPIETVQGALAAALKLERTVQALAHDNMYPRLPDGLDDIIRYDESMAQLAEGMTTFARGLSDEVAKCSSISDPESLSAQDLSALKHAIEDLDTKQRTTFLSAGLNGLSFSLRHWTDHAAVLSNNVEFEHGPTPWSQKAKEVEAARKKDDEAARQLQTLTAEHRATVLKIHEREQVIATKELEIEHLLARIRDATTKTEGLEALQEELNKRHDKIMELEALNRTQTLESEALRERLANSAEAGRSDVEPVTEKTTTIEPAQQTPDPRNVPGGLKTFLDALQSENHWLRERQYKKSFEWNLREMFFKMEDARVEATYRDSMARLDAIELACLTDDDSEGLETPPRTSSPDQQEADLTYHLPTSGRPKMPALELTGISLGWSERAQSHKVALEQAEEEYMQLPAIQEEDDDLLYAWL